MTAWIWGGVNLLCLKVNQLEVSVLMGSRLAHGIVFVLRGEAER